MDRHNVIKSVAREYYRDGIVSVVLALARVANKPPAVQNPKYGVRVYAVCTGEWSEQEELLFETRADNALTKLYALGWRMEEDSAGTYYTDGENAVRISIYDGEDDDCYIVLIETYGESPLTELDEYNISYNRAFRGW